MGERKKKWPAFSFFDLFSSSLTNSRDVNEEKKDATQYWQYASTKRERELNKFVIHMRKIQGRETTCFSTSSSLEFLLFCCRLVCFLSAIRSDHVSVSFLHRTNQITHHRWQRHTCCSFNVYARACVYLFGRATLMLIYKGGPFPVLRLYSTVSLAIFFLRAGS